MRVSLNRKLTKGWKVIRLELTVNIGLIENISGHLMLKVRSHSYGNYFHYSISDKNYVKFKHVHMKFE